MKLKFTAKIEKSTLHIEILGCKWSYSTPTIIGIPARREAVKSDISYFEYKSGGFEKTQTGVALCERVVSELSPEFRKKSEISISKLYLSIYGEDETYKRISTLRSYS